MCFKRKRDTSGRLLLQNGQTTGRENHFTADVYIKWSRHRLRPECFKSINLHNEQDQQMLETGRASAGLNGCIIQ